MSERSHIKASGGKYPVAQLIPLCSAQCHFTYNQTVNLRQYCLWMLHLAI